MTTEELIEQVITEITDRGWCQGRQENESGEVCLMGGFVYALQHFSVPMVITSSEEIADWQNSRECRVYEDAMRRLRQVINSMSIPNWNDDYGRSQEDVILALKEAAHGTH